MAAAHRLAASQGGVLTRAQLGSLGFRSRAITQHVAAGIWIPHGRRVLVLPGVPDSLGLRAVVSARTLGADAVVTGIAAVALLGLDGGEPWRCVRAGPLPWIVFPRHARGPFRLIQRTEVPGRMRCGVGLAADQTVMTDLLRFLPEEQARTLALRAAGHRDWQQFMGGLADVVARMGGYPGVGQLRRVAAAVASGVRSEAELLAVGILREAGLTEFRINHSVWIRGRRYMIDLADPDSLLAIEIDGLAYHGPDRFQSDRFRGNQLENAGWRVLRFTWADLTGRPEYVVDEVRRALIALRS
ncbi:MAG: endonuclease domain-containing protein [Candidatus Nanopelagicales bacterium]